MQRIRCRSCGHRVAATAVICPNCHSNPRGFYLRRSWIFTLITAGVLLGAFYSFSQAPEFSRAGVQTNTPTLAPSPTFTPRVVTVVIVLTSAPTVTALPASTRAPTALSSATPTATATTTPTPAGPARTRTPRASTTTRAFPSPSATRGATLTPSALAIPPPRLLGPRNGEQFSGPNKKIFLSFQPSQPLRENEWYHVRVEFKDRAGATVNWCGWTKETTVQFPSYYDDASPDDRAFAWRVNVVRTEIDLPEGCRAVTPGNSSEPSEQWTFYWY